MGCSEIPPAKRVKLLVSAGSAGGWGQRPQPTGIHSFCFCFFSSSLAAPHHGHGIRTAVRCRSVGSGILPHSGQLLSNHGGAYDIHVVSKVKIGSPY